MSSIVRQLYYHKPRPITPWPRVAVGAPYSWDHVISISNKDHEYRSCIWSPCGRFVAAHTTEAVEIRSQLTFELLTTLKPTEIARPLAGPLTYSPDGCSIACGSYNSIVIWDIQTGGVVKEVRCSLKNISMAWSLDGRKVGFVDSRKRVGTHDLASGTTTYSGEFLSTSNPYLWADKRSFWIITTAQTNRYDHTLVEVLEVEQTLAKSHSFIFPWGTMPQPTLNISYSPSTCHFAISTDSTLYIVKDWISNSCLSESESISFHRFSSDGSLFAAAMGERIRIWNCASHGYMQWKELWCPSQTDSFLQFSPNQLSILSSFGNILHGWRLHDLPATPETGRQQYAGLSLSGNHIATAYQSETTITITDLHSRATSQLIDTDVKIRGLALTGSVLLVFGLEIVVAWRLTEEGLVGGVVGGRRASRSDSIWAVPSLYSAFRPEFKVEGHLGMIAPDGKGFPPYFIYHTGTGETFHPDRVPQRFRFSNPWKPSNGLYSSKDHLGFHDLSQHDAPPEGSWHISGIAVREGWVKDPNGRHRLWVPVELRVDWDLMDWRHDTTTQCLLGGQTIFIKF